MSSPVTADGVVYAGVGDDLRAVDGASGKELWRFETDERLGLGSPVAANGMVYVSDENTLYAMEQ